MLIVTIILKVYHHGSFKTDCLTKLIDSVEMRIMKDSHERKHQDNQRHPSENLGLITPQHHLQCSTSFGLPEQTDDHAICPKKFMIKSLLSILMCRFKSFQQQHQIRLKTRTQKDPPKQVLLVPVWFWALSNLSIFRSDASIHELRPLFVTNIRQLWWSRFGFQALQTLKHHQRIKKN